MKRVVSVLVGTLAIAVSALAPVETAAPAAAAPTFAKDVAPIVFKQVREVPSPGRSGADVAAVVRGRAAVGEGHQDQGRGARDAAVGRGS